MTNPRLTIEEVAAAVGVGATTVRRMCDTASPYYDSTFPQPLKISKRKKLWLAQDVTGWLDTRHA